MFHPKWKSRKRISLNQKLYHNMCLAIPGKLVSIEKSTDILFKAGKVSFDGVIREVNLAAVPEAKVGEYVLVHVGMALNVIDEEEALKTLEYFRELGELQDEFGEEKPEE
jgi:hydrogenase expression/formation protein HypC